jgi:ATP/maltotriose-dependent transcriptional regulator MalT
MEGMSYDREVAAENRTPDGFLARARAAFENRAWGEAFEAFARADQLHPLGPDELELWASACYLVGRADGAIDVLSRAYDSRLDGGDTVRAARTAFWIIFMLMEEGERARAGGWISRSEQLIDRLPDDSVALGYKLSLEGYQQVAIHGDFVAAQATAETVIELMRRAGDHDIMTLALNVKGRALIREGRIDAGMAVLDEAMLAATTGRLSPIVVGAVYCSLIEACEEVVALRRAQEWTDELASWCERQKGELPFTAQCLIHRSKIHRRHGDLEEAEAAARRACERYARTTYDLGTGRALYELAEVQRMSGRLEDSEDTYRQASRSGVDPQPGLALLRLAQGEIETAAASMRRLVAETIGAVERIGLLPAHVEVMLAVGDLDTAAKATAELAEHASTYGTDALRAEAAYAEGAVTLAGGDPGSALVKLRQALHGWMSLDAPYQAARTHVLIGQACHQLGDEDTGALEMHAARRQFAELGVPDPTSRTRPGPETDHGLTTREMEVLRLLATGKTNQAIAEHLLIAVKTVDRHVSSILTKLGVASRTAAVAHAYENDLI